MSDKNVKYQDIPFLFDGMLKIVKSVTKITTCSDVIDKLPKLHTKLAVYESLDGVERKLSGKTKLLKIWRANASSKNLVFVVRKSKQTIPLKNKCGLFGDNKQTCEQPTTVKTAHGNSLLTKDKLKEVSDLAFYVRYQKSKIQAINTTSTKLIDNTSGDVQRKILNRITSNSSVNSMDAFLAKADLDKMSQLLSFCGAVTSEKLTAAMSHDQTTETIDVEVDETNSPGINRNVIQRSLKTMKFGLKRKFSAKSKMAPRTTSTGTISSTDTGYHSVKSDKQTSDDKTKRRYNGNSKRHTFIDADLDGVPRHSTPVIGQHLKRTNDVKENTLTMTLLDEFNESDGKNIILQKFMEGLILNVKRSNNGSNNTLLPESNRRRTDRNSLPSFHTQKEKCQFYWNRYCDSDSDSSCCDSDNSGDLDEAFCDNIQDDNDFIQSPLDNIFSSQKKTLRRDSAISNLNKFSLQPVNFDKSEAEFDYSFNCTFPRMDETQSVDFSYNFENSDCSFGEGLSDESLDSFMKTRSFLDESEAEAKGMKTKVFDEE